MKRKEPIQLMSEAKFYESYARYKTKENRYETWQEATHRVMDMHREFYKDIMTPKLSSIIDYAEEAYNNKEILAAQRSLQFGGPQLLSKNAKMYNCTASYCDRLDYFKEMFWLMLCGCGVGFSVQRHHIAKLPALATRGTTIVEHSIEDSIEGWADALDILIKSYFVGTKYSGKRILFDYSQIRPKGAHISGGFKAPGGEPLKKTFNKIEELLDKTSVLTPIIVYDITMHVADAVISGGVRRAATICLFSVDDEEMIKAKTGSWFVDNPQRGRSNNSAVLLRDSTDFNTFNNIMTSVQHSGEPGFVWTDDLEILFNPCVEVGMYGYDDEGNSGWQMCNLTEINGAKSDTEELFFKQCKAAAILGTLQAGYTNFDYLSSTTKKIVEREALIGVGITGFMNNPKVLFDEKIQREGAKEVKKWNKIVASLIGIRQAARTTVVKPSGNASVLLGCSSGIHGEHSPRYIRHVQMNKTTEVGQMFEKMNPDMVQTSVWNDRDYVIAFPIETKKGSIYKSDLLGVKQLEYVKLTQDNWITAGTNNHLCVKPYLKHNVSNTITVDDWGEVTRYIYNNRHTLCGISLLSGGGDKAYPQAPFTEILTHQEIVEKYGEVSLLVSGLIEAGLNAFHQDLWTAISTSLGYGEVLTEEHKDLLKRDFVRRFDKFALNFPNKEKCGDCLKDVYNLHKWWKIHNNTKEINWVDNLQKKDFIEVDTLGATGCSGGACEIEF